MSDYENNGDDETGDEGFKILIATDCHLGYMEKCSIRGDDSFNTFEEILQYGKENEVDFVLLGGDLFHDNKPSQNAIMKCMNLLRKYCLGTRPNKFQFLSDPKMIFKHCMNKTVNFEDPNLNVEMPVFSIHGNHDDPSGAGQIGSMDLLSVSGLINYFGKWTNLNEVKVAPLLFKKGSTHLALYGLSYIKDQRLSRLLRDKKVDMLRPNEIDDCFNIFVLHQNRAKHADYSYVPEQSLPDFLDFVLWGHEHQCRIDPEAVGDKKYVICQPGSPVATSLCQGESVTKYMGILNVKKTSYDLVKQKLKTVRPLVFETIYLHDNDRIKTNPLKKPSDSIMDYVDKHIENEMMAEASEQLTGDPRQPKLPLLRLRLFYSEDDEKFDAFRLEQKYYREVANPGDIILIRKSTAKSIKKGENFYVEDDDAIMEEALGYDQDEPDWSKTVQGGIEKYFRLNENRGKLTVLTVTGLNEALSNYVNKRETGAFDTIIDYEMKETIDYINERDLSDPEDISNAIAEICAKRNGMPREETEARNVLKSTAGRRPRKQSVDSEDEVDAPASDDQDKTIEESPTRGVGRGRRARGTRGATGGRGRAKATASSSTSKVSNVITPAKNSRAGKLPVQITSTKQASITAHFSRSQTLQKKSMYVSDSD